MEKSYLLHCINTLPGQVTIISQGTKKEQTVICLKSLQHTSSENEMKSG